MTFKEGGAFDFNTTFERIKERLQQAVDVARESGMMSGDGTETGRGLGEGALAGVNLGTVHLDELPAYDAPGNSSTVPLSANAASPLASRNNAADPAPPPPASPPNGANVASNVPSDPPPGYEEVQRDSVADELERRLRRA